LDRLWEPGGIKPFPLEFTENIHYFKFLHRFSSPGIKENVLMEVTGITIIAIHKYVNKRFTPGCNEWLLALSPESRRIFNKCMT
jgi:hypothetical protein